eukprot:comp11433_c0_seq1/m.5844 comp11433_c0_seq1/g.5844  ORF comp11433_c0_seq1/g.5844 comp11433_c0_seq1/m.5844 type:complete len:255 (-) comp11433_c0_seq1:63-827(-)
MVDQEQRPKEAVALFVQGVVAGRLLKQDQAKNLVSHCNEYGNVDFTLGEFCQRANAQLQALSLEIKQHTSEEDGTTIVAMVNTYMDEAAQLATSLSPKEVELFKATVVSIVKSREGEINAVDVKIIAGRLEGTKVTKQEVESALERLVADSWLALSGAKVYLGPRTLMELPQYLRDNYQDHMADCDICKVLAVRGATCRNCDTRLHDLCARRLQQQLGTYHAVCSQCREPWPRDVSPEAEREQGEKRSRANRDR